MIKLTLILVTYIRLKMILTENLLLRVGLLALLGLSDELFLDRLPEFSPP